MRMRRLSVLLVALLALALGGCFQRAPQAVSYQQYRQAPAVQATPLPAPSIAAAPEPVVYATPADQVAASRGLLASACSAPGCGAASYAVYPGTGFEQPYLLDAGDRPRITVFGRTA